VSAKRIGVKRFISEPFVLGAGETRRIDIGIDAVLYTLPEVVVNASVLCANRRTQMSRLASLWDEAQTALTATEISRRDTLFRSNVTRYALVLDPVTMRAFSESRIYIEGAAERPFASISGDSLSRIGYWRELPSDTAEYYGPDAEVLLSDAFRRDHCYSIVEGDRERRGLIGLAFEPIVGREIADVRGTFWLDSRTFELRFIEFRYTRLPPTEFISRVGGEVHFTRAPGGAWIVSRWYLRMPQWARYTSGPKAVPKSVRDVFNDAPPAIQRILEEGGSISADGLRAPGISAITGVVLDSVGKPLIGAAIHLAGDWQSRPVDSKGRFRFDSVSAGNYALLVNQPGYEALGLLAATAYVAVSEGGSTDVTLRAIRAREIVPRLCNGLPTTPPRATLRLLAQDSATSALVTGAPLMVSWTEKADPNGGGGREQRLSATTDLNGAVAFCSLPAETPIELSIVRENQEPISVAVFALRKNEVTARLIRVARPQ
jgi:Carboxypeptidase regulatory-like domain